MAFNPMNTLTIIENILCVYRNYCVLNKIQRVILLLRLLLEIALVSFPFIRFTNFSIIMTKTEVLLFALSVAYSFTVIFLALYHTKNFQDLKMRIERNHVYFAKDSVYSRNVRKSCKFTAVVLSTYLVLIESVVILLHVIFDDYVTSHFYHFMTLFYNVRYLFEFAVLYCVLFLLSEQVKCITRKIYNERKLKIDDSDESSNINDDISQEITGFDEWTMVYTNIKECSILVNVVFGVQITITLTSLIFYFIIFLYVIAAMIISGSIIYEILIVYIIKVMAYLIALYALSRGAQTAENSANELRRCLGKLLIYSPIEDGKYKPNKDFLRLVTNRPIKTQAFGYISVDMTLVPKFVMFFTSYTVIALQFNNVV